MAGLHVCKLRPEFGAKITGLNSVTPLDPLVVSRLRGLFKERSALVFPDLNPDARSQTYVAEQLVEEPPIDPDALHATDLDRIIDVNMKGVFWGVNYAVRTMNAIGGGVILNWSSLVGLIPIPSCGAYSMIKASVALPAKSTAIEYGPHNMRCNSLALWSTPGRRRARRLPRLGSRSLHQRRNHSAGRRMGRDAGLIDPFAA